MNAVLEECKNSSNPLPLSMGLNRIRTRKSSATRPAFPEQNGLLAIFSLMEQTGIRYCVLRGAEQLPDTVNSDIDCLVDATITPEMLRALIADNADAIGVQIVRQRGYYFTLRDLNPDSALGFFDLDFQTQCECDGYLYDDADAVLSATVRNRYFRGPATAKDFRANLVRSILLSRLDSTMLQHLGELYGKDRIACQCELENLLGADRAPNVKSAVIAGNLNALADPDLRKHLANRLRKPGAAARLGNLLQNNCNRFARLVKPGGMRVVMLGPDGAGKSSLIGAFETRQNSPFNAVRVQGFAPAIRRLFRSVKLDTSQPHGLSKRSLAGSLLKACYWLVYEFAASAKARIDVSRDRLVLYDRHLVDAIVDPVRYRYGGPSWLLGLIFRIAPKPDLVILLDAPAEVLHARKPELTIEETLRQGSSYRKLVENLPRGRIVNANQSPEKVCESVMDEIVRELAKRS